MAKSSDRSHLLTKMFLILCVFLTMAFLVLIQAESRQSEQIENLQLAVAEQNKEIQLQNKLLLLVYDKQGELFYMERGIASENSQSLTPTFSVDNTLKELQEARELMAGTIDMPQSFILKQENGLFKTAVHMLKQNEVWLYHRPVYEPYIRLFEDDRLYGISLRAGDIIQLHGLREVSEYENLETSPLADQLIIFLIRGEEKLVDSATSTKLSPTAKQVINLSQD